MKISWAHGLIAFFILYIGYLVGTVIKSTTVTHNLVVEDYYAHDLAYQEMYVNAFRNREQLENDLAIEFNDELKQLHFQFGESRKKLEGKIHFYRPSDKGQDQIHDFQLKSPQDQLTLPTDQMIPGKWILKVRWQDELREYYKEEEIIL